MRSNKNHFFLLLLSFLTLPIFISSFCKPTCGDIQIPFPFGIGDDNCYLNEWFKMECRTNGVTGKTFPFLLNISMEVVNISLPVPGDNYNGYLYGDLKLSSVRVKVPITSVGCSTDGKESGSALNLTGTPFFLGDGNNLVAVGCNNKASLTNVEPKMVGCESTCTTTNNSQSIPFFDKVGCSTSPYVNSESILPANYIPVCNTETNEHTVCNGEGCCQVKVSQSVQQLIGVTITNSSKGNMIAGGECRVAFLTDEVYSLSNVTSPELVFSKGYANVSLGWFIQTKDDSFRDSLGCQNREELYSQGRKNRTAKCTCDNHTISEIRYLSCACVNGYRGNPYLPGNCEDINECAESNKVCGGNNFYFTCRNKQGGYECINHHSFEIMIGLGSGAFILIFGGGIWWLRKLLRKRKMRSRKKKFFKRNGGLLLQQQLNTSQGNIQKTRIFSSKELEKATDNFSGNRVLGQGGQGTVYKGMLVDGKSVAVKKSNVVDEDKLQEFINEVIILSQINHRHIVKLLGCCLETEVPVLVYEFVTNGNLFQHLHEEFDDYAVLWGVRMRIAVDIAGAFSYLHSAACSPIYHRDIKSTNILLDEKYRAKVSDFGTSRSVTIDHTHWTTVISGTVGYVDPEYYGSSHFTEKSDVYSFGVVLVELITGEKPVIIITLMNTQEITGLADYFRLAMKENRLFDIIDARIRNDCKLEQVIAVAHLAMRCLKKTGKNRPDMREVSTALERICSSPEDFQVQIQIDGEEKLYRGDSYNTVTARTT